MSASSDTAILTLISSLTSSLESASQALPDALALHPPPEELSLLTNKNELFLAYVQNLVFLLLLKLRHHSILLPDASQESATAKLNIDIVEKLAELRLYLEKGVKPLESRLKYQVEKVIRAAEDAARPQPANALSDRRRRKNQSRTDEEVSGSDRSPSPSDNDSDMDALAAQPNQSALLRPEDTINKAERHKDGIYRPPKITPTALPVTFGKEERTERRPAKAAALDEFIATEYSTAPIAEPSIGSTIRSGGRHTLSQREREQASEKRRYEEENFVRLPTNKRDRVKNKRSQNTFGGEEWRNLGAGLDRVQKLSKRASSSATLLARSRKRAVQDSTRHSREQAGTIFAKRQRR